MNTSIYLLIIHYNLLEIYIFVMENTQIYITHKYAILI